MSDTIEISRSFSFSIKGGMHNNAKGRKNKKQKQKQKGKGKEGKSKFLFSNTKQYKSNPSGQKKKCFVYIPACIVKSCRSLSRRIEKGYDLQKQIF